MAKSGSNLVHSHPSHILCLTPRVKARKPFYSVLPCLVMMYHQTNMDCKSFSISEDLVETFVALTLNIAKLYFCMILWLMMMQHHTKFEWSETSSGQTFTVALTLCLLQSNLFTRHSSLWTWTVELSWLPKNQQIRIHIRNSHDFMVWTQTQLLWPWHWRQKPIFNMTLWLIMMYHHTGFGYTSFSDSYPK